MTQGSEFNEWMLIEGNMSRKSSKEIIHSGHFMVSDFEAEANDDEFEVAVTLPEDKNSDDSLVLEPDKSTTTDNVIVSTNSPEGVGQSSGYNEFNQTMPIPREGFCFAPQIQVTNAYWGIDTKQQHPQISIDSSLTKLFQCMSLAYRQKLTSPKWNRFKGMKLNWKDKIRLNNVIWRCWHMQFIEKRRALIVQFGSPLDVDQHNKPEAVVLEGKYWKRKLGMVTAEYKKWRLFYKNKIMGWTNKDINDLYLSDIDMFDWQPRSVGNSFNSMAIDDDLYTDFSDTLFSSLNNQPFAFPNPREIARAGIADIIQPGLVQLQPNLDDFMDFEPLQELLFGKPLPSVPEESDTGTNENLFNRIIQEPDVNLNSTGRPSPLPYIIPHHQQHMNSDTSYNSSLSEQYNMSMPSTQQPITGKISSKTRNMLKIKQHSVAASKQQKSEEMYAQSTQQQFARSLSPSSFYQSPNAPSSPISPTPYTTTKYAPILPNPFSQQQTSYVSNERPSVVMKQDGNRDNSQDDILFVLPKHIKQRGRSRSGSSLQQLNNAGQSTMVSASSQPSLTAIESSQQQQQPSASVLATNVLLAQLLTSAFTNTSQKPLITVSSGNTTYSRDSSGNVPILPAPPQSSLQPPAPPLAPQPSRLVQPFILQPVSLTSVGDFSPANQFTVPSARGSNSGAIRKRSLTSPPTMTRPTLTSLPTMAHQVPANFTSPPISPPRHKQKGKEERGQYKEHRRVCHINAEQKRRCNIKSGFDMLHNLIPQLSQNPNSKQVSKAAMLYKGAEYIQQLKVERSQLDEEMKSLRQQIESLNTAITNCQAILPATGAPITRQQTNKMNEKFEEWVKERTQQNWKFWIFSFQMRPLFESYTNTVSTVSVDDMCRTTLTWVDQHCTLFDLRPVVLNSLRYLSTSTEILTNPELLPEEARKAVMKQERSKDTNSKARQHR